MEESILGITKLVNAAFGKPALALLNALHIQPSNPQYPIPNHVAMEFLVFALAVVFFLWLRARLSVDNPGGTQQVMETLLRNPMSLGVEVFAGDRQHRALCSVLEFDQRGAGASLANSGSFSAAGLCDCGLPLL